MEKIPTQNNSLVDGRKRVESENSSGSFNFLIKIAKEEANKATVRALLLSKIAQWVKIRVTLNSNSYWFHLGE